MHPEDAENIANFSLDVEHIVDFSLQPEDAEHIVNLPLATFCLQQEDTEHLVNFNYCL